jgi:hypothetical protein
MSWVQDKDHRREVTTQRLSDSETAVLLSHHPCLPAKFGEVSCILPRVWDLERFILISLKG